MISLPGDVLFHINEKHLPYAGNSIRKTSVGSSNLLCSEISTVPKRFYFEGKEKLLKSHFFFCYKKFLTGNTSICNGCLFSSSIAPLIIRYFTFILRVYRNNFRKKSIE